MNPVRISIVRQQRLATCQTCDQRYHLKLGVEGCKQWNCSCPILTKTWLPQTRCPLNKWAE